MSFFNIFDQDEALVCDVLERSEHRQGPSWSCCPYRSWL